MARTTVRRVASASRLSIPVSLLAVPEGAATDHLALWLDESEAVVVARVTRILTLPIREKRRTVGHGDGWEPLHSGSVAGVEVLRTIKGAAKRKLHAWTGGTSGGPPMIVDPQPARVVLDGSAGDGRGRMPFSRIESRDYVTAWPDGHPPADVQPSHGRAKLAAAVAAIERRMARRETPRGDRSSSG